MKNTKEVKDDVVLTESINGIKFKIDTEKSHYFIKDKGDDDFVRVKITDFANRKNDELNERANQVAIQRPYQKINFNKYILVDLSDISRTTLLKLNKEQTIDIACGRKHYDRGRLCLAQSIAQKYGVLFTVKLGKIKDSRIYRFIGHPSNIEKAIAEFDQTWDDISKSFPKKEIRLQEISKAIKTNEHKYRNIDILTRKFLSNPNIRAIKY